MNKKWWIVVGVALVVVLAIIFNSSGVLFSPKLPSWKAELSQCDDGIDNDGDGFVDFGDDPDCSSREDKTENLYEICTIRDLERVATDLSGSYIQKCDVDLEGFDFYPLGNEIDLFSGVYDGNGFIISNFNFTGLYSRHTGLFGYSSGEINNVKLIDSYVKGLRPIGLLVSVNRGIISNTFVSGTVEEVSTLPYYYEGAGLLAGVSGENSTVSNCSSYGEISGTNYVGGLVGYKREGALIKNSFSEAEVRSEGAGGGLIGVSSDYSHSHEETIVNSWASGNINADASAGGLVGVHQDGTILNSFATGDVEVNIGGGAGGLVGFELRGNILDSFATGDVLGGVHVGGLVGLVHDPSPWVYESKLENCYSTGRVTKRLGSEGFVGGLIGDLSNPRADVSNCYSIGGVNEAGVTGGLIGRNQNSNVINSYWNINTSGQTQSAGGEGRTSGEMTSVPRPPDTYVGWDFVDIWDQTNGDYPWLRL